MATAGDGRVPYESGGAGEKFRKRPFQPDIYEEPQNVSQEAGKIVGEEQMGSPAELANAYKGRTIGTGQAPRQDSELFNIIAATSLPETLKASPLHPSTTYMEDLPDDLLLKIFIHLFSKQLAQMRSVSKSWNALLSQSSFTKSHLHHSIHEKHRVLLAFYNEASPSYSEPFTMHTCQPSDLELTNFVKLPVNPQFEKANAVRVIGSVNGLICYSHSDFVIHIWNPSLSAVLTLPPYSTPSRGDNSIEIYFRFGFDPKTDDYKVVKLTGLTGPFKRWLPIEVYCMRKGTWELITERFPSHITKVFDADHACADGHAGRIHWLGCIYNEGANMNSLERIVAFDLGSETFHEIPLPNIAWDRYFHNALGVLSGKLCLIEWDGTDSHEAWVIDEYRVAESWAKRHVFLELNDNATIHGFTSHNEFLVVDEGYIVLYNPIANKTTFLENFRFGRGGLDKIVEYVDSLVWVAPAERVMVDDAGQN